LRYVLDADILIGALDSSDAHHGQVRRLFVAWREQGDAVLVSVVNLSEVLVAPAADRQRLRAAREAVAALRAAGAEGVGRRRGTEGVGRRRGKLCATWLTRRSRSRVCVSFAGDGWCSMVFR
jgi:predicted nucleic acid-binding protein